MSIEKATERRAKASRQIKLPGKSMQYAATDPVDIARTLRANSKLGQAEKKLAALEAKNGR
ncbi:hypothetical protein B5P45_25165 [Phyllobacterium zundukense]|uniref:Uncharacterized protein n=1 Tax=Phyllobacterium zundukense TaxID=1867719 RepID=A0A2N9VS50_9HYPH|nr:hypothetical protein BLM14_14710 [Phyllobacterium zundukense]PIO42318.1 hypothetical protein B5P45_25165 [Phyllobacterium zundukense]